MKKYIICFLLSLFTLNQLHAVPAKYGLLEFKQPDGSVITLCKTGDERAHIVLSPDGYPVAKNADGYYCFAEPDGKGGLNPTSVIVKKITDLSSSEREIVTAIDRSKIATTLNCRQDASKMHVAPQLISRSGSGIGLMDDALLGRKELKGLVILAQYQDVTFSETCNKEFFEEMLNREGFDLFGATGSARDYFIASSAEQFIPEFDVYGPVTLPNNMAYYGENDIKGNDKNPAQMIYDACVGLDSEIDFSEYDLDGDGVVDNVFVFYAGFGEASYGSDDSVWPHQWALTSGALNLELDGVKIDKYACSNELELSNLGKIPCGIGTFVHEFSHVLGLPDLYDTSANGSWTPSTWSVLDQGPYNNDGRTPPAYSVYERYALGWLDPIVLSGPDKVSLEAIDSDNIACIIPTGNENEFFLLENRQQQGWDKYLPGHGMLVWHIDFKKQIWQSNKVNTRSSHNYVDIEEACGKWCDINDFKSYAAYYSALADYAFPGKQNVTSFTDDTAPSMKTWGGKGLSLPITDIAENDGVITFNVAGGRCAASIPVIKEPSAVGDDWFEAAWYPSDGAVSYQLSVRTVSDKEEYSEDIVDFGDESASSVVLPEEWSFISTLGGVFKTEGYYGKAAPALKLSNNGDGFMTPLYDNDVVGVELWLRGQAVNGASKLLVEGFTGEKWVKLEELSLPREAGEVCTVKNIPSDLRQVRFIYNKNVGYLAVDDVTIKFNKPVTALEGYDNIEVGAVTFFVVRGLPTDVKGFAYKVRSIDAEGYFSAWSEEQIVDMTGSNGTNGITEAFNGDACKLYFDGLQICWQGQHTGNVYLSDIFGRVLSRTETDDNAFAVLSAPCAGLYLLSTPDGTKKLLVK